MAKVNNDFEIPLFFVLEFKIVLHYLSKLWVVFGGLVLGGLIGFLLEKSGENRDSGQNV